MEDVRRALSPELTQIVRPGLPGVHEPGLEQELSDEDLVLWEGKKKSAVGCSWVVVFDKMLRKMAS